MAVRIRISETDSGDVEETRISGDGASRHRIVVGVDGSHSSIEALRWAGRIASAIDAGKDAEMLVVGSRGRGGFVGLLLGSVSAYCAEHAWCPVVVVRHPKVWTPK